MRQTETERGNADADYGVLVVKRPGTADPGRWHAYVTAGDIAVIVTGSGYRGHATASPVRLALADLAVLLRAGWGDQREEDAC